MSSLCFQAPGTLLNGFAFAPTGGVGMGVGSAGLLVIGAAGGYGQLAAHLVLGCGIELRVSAMTSGV